MTFRPKPPLAALPALLLALLAGCSDPAPSRTALEDAEISLDRGNGHAAEKTLRTALEAGGTLPEYAAYLGEAAMLQGDLAKARQYLGPGKFSADTAAYGYKQLGRLELKTGNLPAAGAAFDKALRIAPQDAGLWVDIGRLRYRGGEQVQALAAARRALEYDPDDAEALLFRGQLARDAEGAGAALALFSQALEQHPDNIEILSELAATLGDVGRTGEALDIIRRIAVIAPDAPRLHYLQAVIAARAGNSDLARSLLQRASGEEQGRPAGRMLAGILEMEAGNFATAAQILLQLNDRQPDNPQVRRLLVRALSQSGAERELIARFGAEAARPWASPYLKSAVGRAYEAMDRREEAAPLLDAASRSVGLTLAPLPSSLPREILETIREDGGLVSRDRVRDSIRPGETATAVSEASVMARRFPGSADMLSLLGDAQLADGDAQAASETYGRAAQVRQGWSLTKRLMAAHIAAGRREDANALLRAYLLAGSTNSEASHLYARVLGEKGDWLRAKALLESALDYGAWRDPGAIALLSEAELRLSNPGAAREHAWLAYKLQPMNPVTVAALMRATDDEELRARMRKKLNALTRVAGDSDRADAA